MRKLLFALIALFSLFPATCLYFPPNLFTAERPTLFCFATEICVLCTIFIF